MKEYEVEFEKFDYFFAKKTVRKIDFFECASETEARALTYWKFGDLIDILSVKAG